QPNKNAAVLNRVNGGDPSAIHGALKANGNVFVINPNGILVGPGGTIDVHGLVLSTLDVDNGEFLAGGDMKFQGVGEGVTNLGRINAIGGDVFLIGRTVSNSGSISATGTVGLAAGEEVLLTAGEGVNGERMFVRSKGSGASGTGVFNDGSIEGAAVELKAHGNIYALAINNKGSIRATGATNSGGRVFLRGAGGTVQNSGSIRATSSGAGSAGRVLIEAAYAKVDGMIRAQGGEVRITGTDKVEMSASLDATGVGREGGDVIVEGGEITIGSTAVVDVSGDTGGGRARIGGGFQGKDVEVANANRVVIDDGALLRADALVSGKGGNLIVWSDLDTRFAGDLSARGISKGGFAEISGKSTLDVSGDIDLSAVSGPSGTLLLDPTNITISATGAGALGGSTISNVWLSQQLDAGNNIVVATSGAGTENGNIVVGRTDNTTNALADRIQWYQDSAATPGGTLSLLAFGDILVNTAIQSAGQGGVNLVAGWDGATGLLPGDFDMAAVLATMPGGINEGAVDAAGFASGTATGSVYIGATNSRIGVGVGSRWGDTNVAARDLIMRGSTSIGHGWAQLGFNDNGVEYELSRSQNGTTNVLNEWWGSSLGNVQAKNYIALLGGTEFGTGDINTLGDNAFRGAGWGATGNITAGLAGRVDARGGTTASFVQIGHGGVLQDGSEWKRGQTATTLGGQAVSVVVNSFTTRDGILIDPADGRRSFFASTWRTNYAGDSARIDGDISLTAGGDILFMSARDFDGTTDMLNTNVNTSAYALIGHGGEENQGSFHGNIDVEARGVTAAPTGSGAANRGLAGLGIQILGGRGTRSFAAIGHMSGYEGNRLSIWDQTRSGNISVTATTGAIRLQAHNQAIREGNINTGTLVTGDTPTGLGNASDNSNLGSYVQIGHGGQNSSLPAAGGTFTMPGGTNVNNIVPDSSATGDITVYAAGTYLDPENADTPIGILVRAGNRRWQHAMIGHGGTNHNAVNASDQTPSFGATAVTPFGSPSLLASTGYNGNIQVTADKGSIIATGGDNFRADRVWGYGLNFVQIGHGGDTVRGNKGGTISVSAGQGLGALSGDIRFQAGRMFRDHAMLGHGGYDSDGSILGADNTAEINVIARGGISFISPPSGDKDALALSTDYAYWWYSNGSASGTPQTGQPGYWQTEDRFVQLGHGGYASTTVMPNRQDITVTSGTGDVGNADGNAATGGITFVSGDMERDYSQLGHGGHSTGANNADGFTGDITVNALGGGIRFDGSILGAQAVRRATDRSLNGIATSVTTVGYGGGYEAYSQLGHGGYGARGVNIGEIVVNAWGGVDFLAAPAAPVVYNTVTTAPVDAALNAGTNVWVELAGLRDPITTPSTLAFQGSAILSNVIPGTIRIELEDGRVITDLSRNSSDDRNTTNSDTSPNGLFLDGVKVGETNYDWGIIRFNNTTNPLVGSWTPGTPAVVTFQTAQGLKERAYVQLGHGGYDSDGPNNKANDLISNRGDITVLAGGDINFLGGAAHRN
ncbi:MAG: filamentous hemagglutinin N-terminal domain-containing protein, partial [Verrucomicrobiae bacterium]|nr:filamentous hemagglutinin N-terminal domain-containing protein [Verrucomicrobiae bacterium]